MKKTKEYGYLLLKLLVGGLVIFPLLYGICLSFMGMADIFKMPPVLISENMSWNNYRAVFSRVPIFTYFKNTLFVSAVQVAAQILTSSFAAYAFTFFEFRGKKLLFTLVLATMMIPYESNLISNYLTICNLKLVDTYLGLTLPFLANGMSIFILRQFYLTIPRELKEATVIDGCGHMNFLFRIAFPISKSATASLGLYAFVNAYNQYFWPLLVTNKDAMRTIQVGTGILKDSEGADYGLVLAAAMTAIVPAVIVFIVGQKSLVRGMVAGAVKG